MLQHCELVFKQIFVFVLQFPDNLPCSVALQPGPSDVGKVNQSFIVFIQRLLHCSISFNIFWQHHYIFVDTFSCFCLPRGSSWFWDLEHLSLSQLRYEHKLSWVNRMMKKQPEPSSDPALWCWCERRVEGAPDNWFVSCLCVTEMCSGVRGESFLWWKPGHEDRKTVSPASAPGPVQHYWMNPSKKSGVTVFSFTNVIFCAGAQFVSASVRSSSVQRTVKWSRLQKPTSSSWCLTNLCRSRWVCLKRWDYTLSSDQLVHQWAPSHGDWIRPLVLLSVSLSVPACTCLPDSADSSACTCCCFPVCLTCLTCVTCPQTFYHGEPIKVNVEINNSSSRNIKDISVAGEVIRVICVSGVMWQIVQYSCYTWHLMFLLMNVSSVCL